ncbi:hypothetical protein [Oceanithermus sp.]
MRIGLLDTWLNERYQPFWEAYLRELEIETVRPRRPASEVWSEVAEEWPRPARLLAGRLLELKELGVDGVIVPRALGESPRGSGPCPWAVDPAGALERLVAGLPPLIRVTPDLSEKVLGEAARVGQELVQNPQEVRLALERTRSLLKPYKPPAMPRGERLLGLAAEPYLLEDRRLYAEVVEAAGARGWTTVRPDVSLERLREEGERFGLNIDLPADLEFAGAAHYLGRLGRVKGVLILAEDHCPPVERLAQKLSGRLAKANAVHTLGDDPEEALARIEAALS